MQIDPVRLIQARAARAMSQEEAAIAADLSTRTIQRIEAGQPAALESTKALLTIFGADIIHDPADEAATAAVQSPWRIVGTQVSGAARRSAWLAFAGLRLLFAVQFLIIAAAKPIVPDRAGLFVRDEFTAIGLFSRAPIGASELLGYWIMPLMLLAGTALLFSFGTVRRAVWPRLRSWRAA